MSIRHSASLAATGWPAAGDPPRTFWQTDHEGSDVIDGTVGSLQRKLGLEAHWLETVREVSYRLRTG